MESEYLSSAFMSQKPVYYEKPLHYTPKVMGAGVLFSRPHVLWGAGVEAHCK